MAKVTIERIPSVVKPLSVRQTEERLAYLFIAPWVIGFTIFTAGAMLFSLYISMNDTDLLSTSEFVGLGNFAKTFQEKLFYKSLGVTFTYTMMVVPIGTLVALGIAKYKRYNLGNLPVGSGSVPFIINLFPGKTTPVENNILNVI